MREKRDEVIILRLTKTEKHRIYEKMLGMGIRSLSAYIRKMALDGYCLHLDLKELRRMAYLLQMCSNNLNQYAKSTKMESVEQVADAEGMLSEVSSAADSMIYRLDVCFEHYPEFLKNPKIRQKVVGLLQKAKDYIVKLEGEFAYD